MTVAETTTTTPLAELDDAAAPAADRASASLGRAIDATHGLGARSSAPIVGPSALLESWFLRVITDPTGVAEGRKSAAELEATLGVRAIEDLVTASSRLGAADRLAIYHHGYRARLVECVADDYRALARALGPAFEPLARGYVAAHPSRSWDLVPYAAELPAYLATLEGPAWWPARLSVAAARDLARLEWAMVEVTHAPSPAPIALAALAALPPERGGEVVLAPSPALRILAFDHAVHALYKAAMKDEPWPEPLAARSWVAVWRQGGSIWRMALTSVTFALLDALMRGAPLGEALAAVPADAEDDVMRWFTEWMQSGFFAAVHLP